MIGGIPKLVKGKDKNDEKFVEHFETWESTHHLVPQQICAFYPNVIWSCQHDQKGLGFICLALLYL